MSRRRRRLFAPIGMCAAVLVLLAADLAAADRHGRWSGTKGPFAWEARRVGCGIVGQRPSVVRAHTLWRDSPANGYVRLTFVRQVLDEASGTWTTVHRQRRSTKNTVFEGAVIHWRQWFFPFADEGGATSRHSVRFEWLRDRAGRDRVGLRRERDFRPCVVAPG